MGFDGSISDHCNTSPNNHFHHKWQFRKEMRKVEDPFTDIWTDLGLAKNWVLGNSENKFAKTQEKAVGCTGGWGKGDLH